MYGNLYSTYILFQIPIFIVDQSDNIILNNGNHQINLNEPPINNQNINNINIISECYINVDLYNMNNKQFLHHRYIRL